jgi:hypothetical protein
MIGTTRRLVACFRGRTLFVDTLIDNPQISLSHIAIYIYIEGWLASQIEEAASPQHYSPLANISPAIAYWVPGPNTHLGQEEEEAQVV